MAVATTLFTALVFAAVYRFVLRQGGALCSGERCLVRAPFGGVAFTKRGYRDDGLGHYQDAYFDGTDTVLSNVDTDGDFVADCREWSAGENASQWPPVFRLVGGAWIEQPHETYCPQWEPSAAHQDNGR